VSGERDRKTEGREMMGSWFENYTKSNFEEFVAKQDTQKFVYTGTDNFKVFLIDCQERIVTEVLNADVLKFFYDNVAMANVDKTYIDGYIEIGNFSLMQWE
jgi:hypothetical protein